MKHGIFTVKTFTIQGYGTLQTSFPIRQYLIKTQVLSIGSHIVDTLNELENVIIIISLLSHYYASHIIRLLLWFDLRIDPLCKTELPLDHSISLKDNLTTREQALFFRRSSMKYIPNWRSLASLDSPRPGPQHIGGELHPSSKLEQE